MKGTLHISTKKIEEVEGAKGEEFKRTVWRRWFLCRDPELDDQTPVEAAKTSDGRKKLDKLLLFYDRCNADTPTELNFNPPTKWLRWKLHMEEFIDGPEMFAQEEAIFNGSDSPAAMALYTGGGVELHEGGKGICNYCLQRSLSPLVCGRCRSRNYCSKECQAKEWSVHKKTCKQPSETANNGKKKSLQKLPMSQQWTELKSYVNDSYRTYLKALTAKRSGDEERGKSPEPLQPMPSWKQFIAHAINARLIDARVVDDDANNRTIDWDVIGQENKDIVQKLYNFYVAMRMLGPHVDPSLIMQGMAEHDRELQVQDSFDGRFQLDQYKMLPQITAGVDITFTCFGIEKKTGMRSFGIFCELQLYGSEHDDKDSVNTYCRMDVKSHTKPSILELRRAIHCMMISPEGKEYGLNKPHRVQHIVIFNRWGEEYFEAVRYEMMEIGISVEFQTREMAEIACAAYGTDPDGMDPDR